MDELISRQAAIDAMNAKLEDIKLRWRGKVKKGEIAMYLDMRGTIETLPSAEPVRHGKWTADEILYTQGMTACSCCKTEYYRDDLYMVGNNAQGELPNYCPNCGCRMDVE